MSQGASPSFDSMSNFPGGFSLGVQIQGLPILNTYPGRVFWVDSVNGANGNAGTFQRPFASVAGALERMIGPMPTVYADVIMVKPGHRENISSATGLRITLSGVNIIGLGVGNDRPTFVLDTANTATVAIQAQSVAFQNCRFVANFLNIATLFTLGIASVTASISGDIMNVTAVGAGTLYPGQTLISATSGFQTGTRIVRQLTGTTGGVGTYVVNKSQTVASGTITTSARNFNLQGCDIVDTSAILNFVNLVTLPGTDNTADGLNISGNNMFLLAASGAVNLLAAASTTDRAVVANNNYRARTTNAAAVIPITNGKTLTNFTCADNVFDLVNASGTTTGLLITTNQTGNTGVICRNFIQSLDATSELLVTASSGFVFFNNYYSGAADASGYLLPAADS